MARILSALTTLRRQPLCLDSAPDIGRICREQNHVFRERLLTPLVTLQLFFLQILHRNTAITHLRQLSGLQFSPSSYSEARARLPLAVLEQFLKQMAKLVTKNIGTPPPTIFSGRRLVLVDAFTFSMPDKPGLLSCFGMPTGQRPGVGYPVCKVMALLDYATGMFIRMLPASGGLFMHDMRGAIGLHPDLKKGDILLGDTAFCSFTHMCLLAKLEVDGVFRLHQRRPKTAGSQTWHRPQKPPAWMSGEEYESLPASVCVRVVKHIVTQRGFRTKTIFIATTLRDKEAWPDETIIETYGRRWDIETCFAHLKTTMNMDVLKCKSLDGIRKELAVYMIVYNRVRLEMLDAGAEQCVDPRRISFVDAMRRLAALMTGLSGVAQLIVNPLRPGRHEPRMKRRRPRQYPLMRKPRRVLKMALFAA